MSVGDDSALVRRLVTDGVLTPRAAAARWQRDDYEDVEVVMRGRPTDLAVPVGRVGEDEREWLPFSVVDQDASDRPDDAAVGEVLRLRIRSWWLRRVGWI